MASRVIGSGGRWCEDEFFGAVRDGDLGFIKQKWRQLKNDPASHDLSNILVRAGESYWGNSHVKDEEKDRFSLWIRAKEAKLEGRWDQGECEDLSYQDVKRNLYSAVSRLHLNDLHIVIGQIKQFHAKNSNLSPEFFLREWQWIKNIVADRKDSKDKRPFLEIINDAIQRIESKKVLLILVNRLRSWNLEALSESVEKIYADQASLFPLSSRTIESDWEAARQCIGPQLDSEQQERALSIFSDAKERLDRGWNPYFDEIEDFDSGFL